MKTKYKPWVRFKRLVFSLCFTPLLNSQSTADQFEFPFRYLLQYQEPIPCEQLVTTLCDIKQAYTQFGGEFHIQTISLIFKCIWICLLFHCVTNVWFLFNRKKTIWCFSTLHGMGQTLRFPVVPKWPQWQLWRLEGNMHWQQQCCKSEMAFYNMNLS